ncbi:MAG: FtsW/RodA/SpoVE family cell cycle protein [Haliscomenobacter sp.]|nr:FtsW/RodA/SpoVE family cell cycle protein [Haliscomenobacter sp.]MBK8655591.1 FtsW/RodA/SpoVE family cell cycle protein [Haliscomenobacter sp.]MBP9078009.1 FtsW/RodA/SpoVE family cell cycle protein [Haliscomenobacter sp.]
MSTVIARLSAELRGDRSIWAVIAVLAVFSLLAVYSSTGTLAYLKQGGNTEAYLVRHGIILIGGLLLVYVVHLMNYSLFSRLAPGLMMIAIPLLLYTLVFGVNINDARRWIEIPFVGRTFQPSDLAKLALILYVARTISGKQEYIKDLHSAFIPIIVPVLIVCGLIAPADLSSAVLLFFTCVLMMVVGRVSLQYIGLLLFLGVVTFGVLVTLGNYFPEYIRVETWIARVNDFMFDPNGGYQVQQAKIAIANGEWLGAGPGNSIQRNYLPSPYADFIYAIICEEYGIIGGAVLISMYVVLFFRVTRLVTKSPKAFGAIVAIGLSISMVLQAFINIAVSTHLVPVTGVTLPMVSMGGTSIMFSCLAFGVILSVSRYVESLES